MEREEKSNGKKPAPSNLEEDPESSSILYQSDSNPEEKRSTQGYYVPQHIVTVSTGVNTTPRHSNTQQLESLKERDFLSNDSESIYVQASDEDDSDSNISDRSTHASIVSSTRITSPSTIEGCAEGVSIKSHPSRIEIIC